MRGVLIVSLTAVALLAPGVAAGGGSVYVGDPSTDTKPQSKLWTHEGVWWGVLHDGADHFIHRLEDGAAVRLTGGLVDERGSARADVLWNGQHLFVLMGHSTASYLHKFTYAAGSYARVTGFPVALPLGAGWSAANLAQDSTGRLWVAFAEGGRIRVLWSSSVDHLAWDTTGLVLESGAYTDEVAAVAAFGARIGVMWSDLRRGRFGFRWRNDADAPATWQALETPSSVPSVVDNHVNLAVTPAGTILAATKSATEHINLFVRDPLSGWSGPHEVGVAGTRPVVLYDRTNADVHVLYTDTARVPWKIVRKRAALADVASFGLEPAVDFLSGTASFNDVTATKQALNFESGLVAAAKRTDYVEWSRLALRDPTPAPGAVLAQINFQPAAAAVPDGYAADTGARFSAARNYGWSTALGGEEREAIADQRLDTFLEIRNPATSDWEYALDPGYYFVTLVAGDPLWSGEHRVALEGAVVVDNVFTTREFVTVTDRLVRVDDGRLTLTLGGATQKKAKLCYLIIRRDANNAPPNTPPQVSAAADVLTGDAPLTVSFTGAASDDGQISGWAWDFDDGTSATGPAPVHTFTSAGTYRVEATVTDDGGLSATATVVVLVAPNTPPVPAASADITLGVAPLAVSFTGSATDNGTIVSWAWDFGDGATSSARSPAHTFASAGDHVVRLRVTDNGGLTAEDRLVIRVDAPPVAHVAADVTLGLAPLAVAFAGSATDNGTIVSWAWDFGDGTTSSAQSPSHAFAAVGSYVVTLTVTDDGGLSDAATALVTVEAAPVPSASADVTLGQGPLAVSFTGSATDNGTIVSWAWDFGDGSTSSARSPTHTFTEVGTYTVQLTVTDDAGYTGGDTLVVTVEPSGPGAVVARVNFQPASSVAPAGYTADGGAKFAAARGYGWDRTVATKDRDEHPDQRLDTYAYVSNSDPAAVWEYALADGSYYVTVVVGSADWTGIHKVVLEGTTVVDSVYTGRGEFVEVVDRFVTVRDGRLTLALGGAGDGSKKSKLCYLLVHEAR